jgi:hypothetical protein
MCLSCFAKNSSCIKLSNMIYFKHRYKGGIIECTLV